jgi:hypothetical protein
LADKLTAGAGDSIISKADAKEILGAVKDGNTYKDIEKATMKYLRENYNLTDAADEWFRQEIRVWAANK